MYDASGVGTSGTGRPSVLSIVGPGRSGTTIMASILGEVPGVFSAGEMRWLWRRGVLEQRTCGCGQPPAQCPLWSIVVDRVLAGRLHLVPEIVRAQQELSSRRNRLRLIRSVGTNPKTWEALRRIRGVTEQVCAALVEGTGARVVVDTSKRAQEAAVWASVNSIEHYVLHVIRDPRAVAYSWRRAKPAGPSGDEAMMGTRRLLPSILRWTENSIGVELLHRRLPADRWMSVRYEDFVAEPRKTVECILTFLGLPTHTPFDDETTVALGDNHIVAGNPSRFRRGPVDVVPDSEWQQEMGRGDQALVAALTAPLLRRYGYPLRPSAVSLTAEARA